jgi:hypothetical protein
MERKLAYPIEQGSHHQWYVVLIFYALCDLKSRSLCGLLSPNLELQPNHEKSTKQSQIKKHSRKHLITTSQNWSGPVKQE